MSVNEETVELRSDSPNTTTDSAASSTKSNETSVRLGKELELLMEALNCLETPEQRIAALCKKYSDLLEDRRVVAKHLKKSQKEINQLKKEKESETKARLTADKIAATHKAAAAKLESLCRELQNQNRSMKNDLFQNAKSEEEKRKQLIEKFQGSLEGITKQLDKNAETNNALKQDNEKLSETLLKVGEQYKSREEQFSKALDMMKERENLLEQKMKTIEEAGQADGIKLSQTLNALMEKTQMVISLTTEKEQLHRQVQYYSEKFEDFNGTLTKSNEAISGFSAEMQKLQKFNIRLEKNAEEWKMKHYNCQQQLIALTESNLKQNEKNQKLEQLCRALQERTANITSAPKTTVSALNDNQEDEKENKDISQ